MSNETREHLSCLMDGELSEEASVFMTRRLGSDGKLGETWERYHLIRDCMRRPGEARAAEAIRIDFAVLEEEEARQVTPSGSEHRWLRPVSGFAIAASVAAVAVMVTLNLGVPSTQSQPDPSQPFNSPNPLSGGPVSQPASFGGSNYHEQQRIKGYLSRHNQVAGSVGRRGFVSFVPIVVTAPVQVPEQEAEPEARSDTGTQVTER